MSDFSQNITLQAFLDLPDVVHLELGAGCGSFGQLYFSQCFLSDRKSLEQLKKRCPNVPANTIICNADNIPCLENRFSKVILCNPYGYGFRDMEDGEVLLKELYRVTRAGGEVVIISSDRNPYGTSSNVGRRIEEFNEDFVKFVMNVSNIDAEVVYKGYVFRTTGNSITVPNRRIVLECKK